MTEIDFTVIKIDLGEMKIGNRFIGRGQSTDVVEASIKAYINGINRLYNK